MERGKGKEMKRITLMTDIGQTVYVVFASKKEGYKDNIVFRAKVIRITINEDRRLLYVCYIEKCVTGNADPEKYVKSFMYYNSNVDTGVRGVSDGRLSIKVCPVFTDKEKCLKWLRG